MFDYLDAARFWSKVEVKGVNECWPFSACKGAFGHGQRNGRSKLTVKDVHEIRVATCTVTELAKLFGVDRKVIRDIKAGKTWRDV